MNHRESVLQEIDDLFCYFCHHGVAETRKTEINFVFSLLFCALKVEIVASP